MYEHVLLCKRGRFFRAVAGAGLIALLYTGHSADASEGTGQRPKPAPKPSDGRRPPARLEQRQSFAQTPRRDAGVVNAVDVTGCSGRQVPTERVEPPGERPPQAGSRARPGDGRHHFSRRTGIQGRNFHYTLKVSPREGPVVTTPSPAQPCG